MKKQMNVGNIAEHYKNIIDSPAEWFGVMREQVLAHKDINASDYLKDPARTDIERENHFRSGMFLAYDLLKAAEAYIVALESHQVAHQRTEVAGPTLPHQLPTEVPWERLRTVTLTFSEENK